MDIFLLFIVVFANARLAGKRGRNAVGWGLLTFVAFLLFLGVFGAIFTMVGYKGPMTPEALRAYVDTVKNNPLKNFTILMFGVGGGLLVRAILQNIQPRIRQKNLD